MRGIVERVDGKPVAFRQMLLGGTVARTIIGKDGAQKRHRINRINYRPISPKRAVSKNGLK